MAHEDYRSPRVQAQPYETSDTQYPPPGSYQANHAVPPKPDIESRRARAYSNAQSDSYNTDPSRYSHARQPINDAVASAFNTTENTNALSPEMLNQITSQITANVLQKLQANSIVPPAPTQGQYGGAAMATSPSTTGSPPPEQRKVYTPPSPHRASEETAQTVASPKPAKAKPSPTFGRGTPPLDHRTTSPQSQASQAEDSDAREGRSSRPRGPKRLDTSADPTTLEKIWGTLFNEHGQATKRLGQFLRGIAVHLIEDYEPQSSLVITPAKMQKYYADTKLPNELYPWEIVFDDHTSSISRLFRELETQHHLVQEKLDERPDIPGLTPFGFERWVTLLLLAHPEQEFARLQKTALDMPISNPDDKKERFPKDISRRLFPIHDDTEIAAKIQKAMIIHCNITILPKQSNIIIPDQKSPPTAYRSTEGGAQTSAMYPPPPTRNGTESTITPASSRSMPQANYPDRDRKPYSNPPSEAAVDEEEDDTPTPQPIERERKPYVAQPGGGKTYDDLEKVASASSQPPAPEHTKLTRSSSIASHGRPSDQPKSRPIPIAVHQRPPPPAMEGMPMSADSSRHNRSNSIYTREQHSSSRRVRSPSTGTNRDYGHRSEGELSFGSYGSADEGPEARRYRDYERERERLGNDRYDAARMAAYDPREREREREPRQRFQSTVGLEAGKGHYLTDEEYYRAMGGIIGAGGGSVGAAAYPPTGTARDGFAQYPPSSYDGRR